MAIKVSMAIAAITAIRYRVTQNKVHHLLSFLYLILEANNTQVSYVIQYIIVHEVQFNEVLF